MLINLRVFIILIKSTCYYTFVSGNVNWELAVALKDRISLLSSKGDLADEFEFHNENLRALAYDSIERQLYFSDSEHKLFSIFSLEPASVTTDVIPVVIKQTEGTVRDITIDTLTGTLYWTIEHRIKYLRFSDTLIPHRGFTLVKFEDYLRPFGISVDVCRKYIYWTDIFQLKYGSVGRVTLDGKNQTILVNTTHTPLGITVDQYTKRVYWAEDTSGSVMEFKSLSIANDNLETKPKVHFKVSPSHNPIALCVLDSRLFWTDVSSDSIYTALLNPNDNEIALLRLANYSSKVFGIVSVSQDSYPDPDECSNLIEKEIKVREQLLELVDLRNRNGVQISETTGGTDGIIEAVEVNFCLYGVITNNKCICHEGFSGNSCETNMCQNYCLNGGVCEFKDGSPKCHCHIGWKGTRCEIDLCRHRCLNNGVCTLLNQNKPQCECKPSFTGEYCENNIVVQEHLCIVHCILSKSGFGYWRLRELSSGHTIPAILSKLSFSCKCSDYTDILNKVKKSVSNGISDLTGISPKLHGSGNNVIRKCGASVWVYLVMVALIFICLFLTLLTSALTSKISSLKKRPRVVKKVVVHKRVSLAEKHGSERSPEGEKSDATIENCCSNVNIRRTSRLKSGSNDNSKEKLKKPQKDDKRNLLTGIELPPDDV